MKKLILSLLLGIATIAEVSAVQTEQSAQIDSESAKKPQNSEPQENTRKDETRRHRPLWYRALLLS
jgi:hypothetical protein